MSCLITPFHLFWGEWPSGSRRYIQNWKDPSSNATRCLIGLWDPTLLWGPPVTFGLNKYQNGVINTRLLRLPIDSGPKLALGQPNSRWKIIIENKNGKYWINENPSACISNLSRVPMFCSNRFIISKDHFPHTDWNPRFNPKHIITFVWTSMWHVGKKRRLLPQAVTYDHHASSDIPFQSSSLTLL